MNISTRKLAVVAIFIALLAFQCATLLRFNSNIDEGLVLSSAMKAAEGQVMYRDFFEFWSPGAVYFMAGAMRAFGQTWWIMHLIGILVNWLILVLYYLVSRKILSTKASLGMVIFYAYIMLCAPGVNHHWFATVFLLLSMLFASRTLTSTSSKTLTNTIWSGIFAGLSICFMQYEGFVAASGGLLSITTLVNIKTRWRHVGTFLISMLLPIVITALYFIRQHAMAPAFYSTVIFPLTQYHNVNGRVPDAFWIMQSVLIVFAWLKLRQLGQFGRLQKWLLIYTGSMQIASGAASSYHGIVTSYLANYFIYIGLVGPILNSAYNRGSLKSVISIPVQVAQKPLRKFLPVLMSAVFLVGYGLVCLAIPGRTYASLLTANQPVQTASGLLYTTSIHADRIKVMQQFFSQRGVRSGQVYFGPYSSQYFFFFHLTNPIKYSQITPRYNPDWMLKNAAQQLEMQKVSFVVLMPQESPFRFDGHDPFTHYVKANYHQVEILPKLENPINPASEMPDAIWQRNDLPR